MLYGRDELEWDELVDATRTFLVSVARQGRATSYAELNSHLVQVTGHRPFNFSDPADRAAVGHLLGRVVTEDPETYGPGPSDRLMLSALVLHGGGADAGSGLYTLAADLGLLPRTTSPSQRDEFLVLQHRRLREHYATS